MNAIKSNNKKIFHFIKVIFIAIMLTLLFPIDAFSMHSESHETLIFLGNEDLAPIVYDDNGKAKGVAVDVAEALEDRLGYDIEVMAVNWEQAQKMVLNGEADGLLHINPSMERSELYDFSSPLLESEFSLFISNGNASIKSIDDLKGKSVGIEPGGYPNALLQEYEETNIEPIYNWETSFRDLSAGDLDAIIVDRWIGEYELAQSRIDGIKVVEKPIETQYSRIAVQKDNGQLISQINSALMEIIEDGTFDEIIGRWQGKRVVYFTEDDFQSFMFRSASIILLFIALVAIYLVYKYRKLSRKLEISVKDRTDELHYANKRLIEANAELERISLMDGLTSVENRRAFDIAYNKAWRLSLREKRPFSLIMIDIDHFKPYNDTYGHLMGDQALIRIAEVLKNVVQRPGDLVARYGGEEFVILLTNTTAKGATTIAEKARRNVEELKIRNRKIETVLTITLGVASTIPVEDMDPKELIDTADKALYKAKEDGRNKVEIG